MDKILKGFPVIVEFPIAWGEMDARKHVNNVHYFRYFENARIAYWDRIGAWEIMEKTGAGTVLASAHCAYMRPLTYPDTLSVGAKVTGLESDHFTMTYRIVSRRMNKIAAEGKAELVAFDFLRNRKTVVPDEMKANILQLESCP